MRRGTFLTRDLVDHRWMIAKAVLFVVVFVLCGVVVVMRGGEGAWARVGVAGVYVLGAWSASRAYYFGFYVIAAYCDPAYRYAGVWSAARWALCNLRRAR